jgi:uncharacterized membrane protein YdjX (TVP38/TMEM64 family)
MAAREHRAGVAAFIGAIAWFAALGIVWYVAPVRDWLDAARDWLVGLGFGGVILFAAIYVVGAVVLAPAAVLTISAGFAYGFWGLPIVLVAATTGASLAFLIARYAVRDSVRRLVERRRKIAAIDRAIAEDGWKIALLLRLSPLIPFNLQNYLLGLTAIRFGHFVAATVAGILPGAVLYTCLGALGEAALGEVGPAKWTFFGAGLSATAIAVILIARKARAKLHEAGVDPVS